MPSGIIAPCENHVSAEMWWVKIEALHNQSSARHEALQYEGRQRLLATEPCLYRERRGHETKGKDRCQ
jgi:hypothetical protein